MDEFIKYLMEFGMDEATAKKAAEGMKGRKLYLASEENLDVRYGKLKADHEGMTKQAAEQAELIEQLKKGTKGQEAMQAKIAEYEAKITQMQAELEQTKVDAAVKVALLSEKAVDVDYLAYKLGETLKKDGETLTLDDNGNIKGWADRLSGLKTQFPTMFTSSEGDGKGYKVLEPNKLGQGDEGMLHPSKEAFQAMGYEERLKVKQQSEELYKQLAK